MIWILYLGNQTHKYIAYGLTFNNFPFLERVIERGHRRTKAVRKGSKGTDTKLPFLSNVSAVSQKKS